MFQNTNNFYLQNMSDKIKVHAIFSNKDKLCPPERQLSILNTVPRNSRGRYEYFDDCKLDDDQVYYCEHGDLVGR